jgi:hypothetical protein
MLNEVLYMPGCPNHQPTAESIRNILQSEALLMPIHEIPVTDDACALQFPGSPTVRINKQDAELNQKESHDLVRRLYSGRRGMPPN